MRFCLLVSARILGNVLHCHFLRNPSLFPGGFTSDRSPWLYEFNSNFQDWNKFSATAAVDKLCGSFEYPEFSCCWILWTERISTNIIKYHQRCNKAYFTRMRDPSQNAIWKVVHGHSDSLLLTNFFCSLLGCETVLNCLMSIESISFFSVKTLLCLETENRELISNNRTATGTKVCSRYFKLRRADSTSIISSNVGDFFESWILRTVSKFRKRKRGSLSCDYVLHKKCK